MGGKYARVKREDVRQRARTRSKSIYIWFHNLKNRNCLSYKKHYLKNRWKRKAFVFKKRSLKFFFFLKVNSVFIVHARAGRVSRISRPFDTLAHFCSYNNSQINFCFRSNTDCSTIEVNWTLLNAALLLHGQNYNLKEKILKKFNFFSVVKSLCW
jgi:hypothetical protein